jgi:Mn-dependent DtxR family transcriptional regulator
MGGKIGRYQEGVKERMESTLWAMSTSDRQTQEANKIDIAECLQVTSDSQLPP